MKDIILFLVLAILIHSCTSTKEKNQVTVLGTVHFPTANINSDSIYQVLKKIRPDFILMELDTMFFDKDYSFSQTLDENEFKAVAKYVEEFPTVNVRPIEFKGRNSYRKKIGIYSDASLVFRNFNNINRSKTYTNEEQRKWDRFVHFWSKSTAIDTTDLRGLNNPKSDNIKN